MDRSPALQNRVLLQNNPLFSGVGEQELDEIVSIITERQFKANEFIIREEEPADDEFYLIKSGAVEILKSSDEDAHAFLRITTLSVGETIGEVALLEESRRTASARALEDTTVLVLPINAIRERSSHQKHYAAIMAQLKNLQRELAEPPSYARMALNLAKSLSQRLYNTNVITAAALRQELKLSQLRVATGRFLILVISAMVIYAYSLAAIGSLAKFLPSTTFLTLPNMIFFTCIIIYFMVTTGYPLSFFGLTLKNWRRSVIEGIVWSIPVMALIVLTKWLIIHYMHYNIPLFAGPQEAFHGLTPAMQIVLIVVYLIFTPLQELLVRGGIQSCLQYFLEGKHRVIAAIIVSNLIFGMVHLHMSFSIGVVVLVFGVFWGFMYARQGNLIGVSLSHLLIGGWGFFVVGVRSILIT